MNATTEATQALTLSERTGPGRGALRVLVLEGDGALSCVQGFTVKGAPKGLGVFPVRLVQPSESVSAGELLDEVVLVVHSQREVELHVHGSPIVVARVMGAFKERGVREIQGSFEEWVGTGPLERQAAELLAHAPGDRSARVLLDQAQGAFSRSIEELREANERGDDVRVGAIVEGLLKRWDSTRRLLSPPRVVLAGPANAGKSTLFNLMLGRQRVLVSSEEGTTRDAIRHLGPLGPWIVEWTDTAGERELGSLGGASQALEAAGQELARSARAQADLVLWLSPDPAAQPDKGALALTTCGDLLPAEQRGSRPCISVKEDPLGAHRTLCALVTSHLGLAREPWEAGSASPFSQDQAELLASVRRTCGRTERRVLLLRFLG